MYINLFEIISVVIFTVSYLLIIICIFFGKDKKVNLMSQDFHKSYQEYIDEAKERQNEKN